MMPVIKALYFLAAFKYTSGALKIIAMGLTAGTAGAYWGEMSEGARLLLVTSIAVQVLTYTEAFIDQTASKIAAGKPPIGTNGGTEHLLKAQAVATITEEPKP